MVSNARQSRNQRMVERADMLFYLYYQMADRSIPKLWETVSMMGLRLSEKTIKRYSADFQWQKRILELDTKARESNDTEAIKTVQQMNTRHAQVHQAFMGLGVAGIRKYQEDIAAKHLAGIPETLDLTVQDIARILEQGQKGERLARGEATSRTEIMVETISSFVREFALIFIGINSIKDEEERVAEYAVRCDDMLHRVYPAAQAGSLNLIDRG